MQTYKRDDTQLHTAPTIILWINVFMWIVLIIGLILTFTILYRLNGFMLLGIVGIYEIFVENYYNYYENAQIQIENNKITYTYNLNSEFIPSGSSLVTYKIKDITKVKKKHNKIKVYGTITKKMPLGKLQELKSCEMVTNHFDISTEELINKIKEKENRDANK